MSLPISRRAYADMYGPTTGDRVRLNIPAGPAARFGPGGRGRVTLVALAGEWLAHGGNGRIAGRLDEAGKKQQALGKM